MLSTWSGCVCMHLAMYSNNIIMDSETFLPVLWHWNVLVNFYYVLAVSMIHQYEFDSKLFT